MTENPTLMNQTDSDDPSTTRVEPNSTSGGSALVSVFCPSCQTRSMHELLEPVGTFHAKVKCGQDTCGHTYHCVVS